MRGAWHSRRSKDNFVTDNLSPSQRRHCMQKIGSKDTKPERIVRSTLHRLGYRFRLHATEMPGTPDIVLPRLRTVIFVHGCFWHGHKGCPKAEIPSTNTAFWNLKLLRNKERDTRARRALRVLGWRAVIIWECQTRRRERLIRRLRALGVAKGNIPASPKALRPHDNYANRDSHLAIHP